MFTLRRSFCNKGYYIVVTGSNRVGISTVGFYDLKERVLYFHFQRYMKFLREGALCSRGVLQVLSFFSAGGVHG